MKDVLPEVDAWRSAGNQVAIAAVVKVEGSAPRPVGATMAVSSAGDLTGSVSGGCVESAVFEEAQEVLRTGQPKLIRYGITDEMAWDVGLACGGMIEVFVEPVTECPVSRHRASRSSPASSRRSPSEFRSPWPPSSAVVRSGPSS